MNAGWDYAVFVRGVFFAYNRIMIRSIDAVATSFEELHKRSLGHERRKNGATIKLLAV